MSFNSSKFADKENALKQSLGSNKSNVINENTFKVSKQQVQNTQQQKQQGLNQQPRRNRVPLGGKDQNKAFPTLQRSQSSISGTKNEKIIPKINSSIKQQRQKQAFLQKAPFLQKANSSLGFSHSQNNNVINERRSQIKKANPLQNNLFKFEGNQTSSDELAKKSNLPALPKIQNLESTITFNTQRLHANNIINLDINQNNVDPVKSSKPLIEKKFVIPQHLIDDPLSIEITPIKEDPLPDKPFDVPHFTNDDLEIFSKGYSKLTKDNTYEHPDIKQNEIKLNFQDINLDKELKFDDNDDIKSIDLNDQPRPDNVGLTVDELNDLLDF